MVGVHVQDDLGPNTQRGDIQHVVELAAAGFIAVGVGVGDFLDVGAELDALGAVGAVGSVVARQLDPKAHAVIGVELPLASVLGVLARKPAEAGVGGIAVVVVRIELGIE